MFIWFFFSFTKSFSSIHFCWLDDVFCPFRACSFIVFQSLHAFFILSFVCYLDDFGLDAVIHNDLIFFSVGTQIHLCCYVSLYFIENLFIMFSFFCLAQLIFLLLSRDFCPLFSSCTFFPILLILFIFSPTSHSLPWI